MLQVDVNSKDAAGAYELWVNQDGKLVPAAEFTVDQDGKGQARFELDQPFGDYESVHIRAKALDPGQAGSQSDTLVRDSSGALGLDRLRTRHQPVTSRRSPTRTSRRAIR